MRKVLLLIHRLLQGGGTETHVRLLATRLARSGWQVGVFTAGGPWVSDLQRQGIRIHLADGEQDARLKILKSVVAREGYTLLHAHDGSSCKMAAMLRSAGTRVVVTIHGAYMFDEEVQKAARQADAVVAVSQDLATQARLAGVSAKRLHVIYNGISTHAFHPGRADQLRAQYSIPGDAFVIGYAGRFTYAKGELGKRVVRALYTYVDSHPDVYLLVAGRDSREQVRTRHKRIKICGHVENMGLFYRACNVVVGTGRVALEAAATASPTIAVGEMAWIGRLSTENLARAATSNFGDHGRHQTRWRNAQLVTAVKEVKANHTDAEAGARELRKQVVQRFSAAQMSHAMLRVYRGVRQSSKAHKVR